MVSKKRKATSKVAEAARKYTPSSAKAKPGALGEALWEMLEKLSDEEQGAFIRRMLSTPEWREEIGDSIIVIESNGEPTRPIEEFFAELERERAK
jgi:hypothetical protein